MTVIQNLNNTELLDLIESLKTALRENIQPGEFGESDVEETYKATLRNAEKEAAGRGLSSEPVQKR